GSCLGMGGLLVGGDSSGRRGGGADVPGPAAVAVAGGAFVGSRGGAGGAGVHAAGCSGSLPVGQAAWVGADIAVAVGDQGGRGGAGAAAVVVVGVEDDLVVAGEFAEGGARAGVSHRAGGGEWRESARAP